MTIKPTVGRMLLFFPAEEDIVAQTPSEPLAAIVAKVHSDTCVNLMVVDANGTPFNRTSVPLIQEGEEKPPGGFCEWMPYQKGQAAKTEALADQLRFKEAVIATAEAEALGQTSFGWVIEHVDSDPGRPVYFNGDISQPTRWTVPGDHAAAIRFARQLDAERMAAWLTKIDGCRHRVAEHGWSEQKAEAA